MKHFGFEDDCPPIEEATYWRKHAITRMWEMDKPFLCTNREGKDMRGKAGDFLAEDGYGGFYPIGSKFHKENYEHAEKED